ncbi:hypothetical protein CK203_048903 [Vitis vinifera]|uniref:Uncharacterized protein n=1 Tax=Vitis vinifera TaxID=29760 RepID=A0A438FKU4_VITVI|nr:hypothetical protein CK203_048903 [Vitis vinifera]
MGWGRRGPIPFRFENMWLKRRALRSFLRAGGKVSITVGATERFKRVGVRARKEARETLRMALMEEISWRQKSRETWLKEGDKNTRFFHKMTNSNRRRNCLKKIKVNGNWLSEDQEIQRGVVRAYQDLLLDPGGWHPSMNIMEFDRIRSEEAARLEEMFSMEEVFLALSELNGTRLLVRMVSPLLSGSFCWDFVKDDLMGFFKDFFERGKFVRSPNSTFLVLVPKKGGADDLRDYRPISLVEACISFSPRS